MNFALSAAGLVDIELEHRTTATPSVESGGNPSGALLRVWHGGYPVGSAWTGDLRSPRVLARRVGAAVAERAISRALLHNGDRPFGLRDFVDHAIAADPEEGLGALPSLTIAVCTRDRVQDLEQCLASLVSLSYPGFLEVLVVDNASATGETADLCSRFAPRVRYVREERPGLDWARNRAIAEANGSIVAFTDDDCVVDPNWAVQVASPFVIDSQVEAVTGLVTPLELATDAQRLFEQIGGFGRGYRRRWFRHTPARGTRIASRFGRSSQFGTGASMAFRTATLRRIGGFDPALDTGTLTLGAGDLEMFFRILKLGGALVYEPTAVVHHRHRRTMDELEAQMRSWGSGMTSYIASSVRSWSDERRGFAFISAWMMQHWATRLTLAALGSRRMPMRMAAAEARAGVTSVARYRKAQRVAAAIAEASGETLPDHQVSAEQRAQGPRLTETLVRHVPLDRPVPSIEGSERTSKLRVIGTWDGVAICTAEIDAQGQSIPSVQVADALAAAIVKRPEIAGLATAFVESRLAPVIPSLRRSR